MKSFQGEIVSVKELRQKPTAIDSTLHLDIRLPEGVSYNTGENLKIYPQTSKQLITKLLDHLGMNAFSKLTFVTKSKAPFPSGITVEELLTDYIDLQAFLKKSTIKALLDISKSESAKSE